MELVIIGGITSRIRAVVDALGNLIAFTITGSQVSEYHQAEHLLKSYHNTTFWLIKVTTAEE